MPIVPLEKGESVHGISLQTQSSSTLNYHYNTGLTRYLDLGFQAGIVNAGASARLHLPMGHKTEWALTNAFLAYRDPGESWNGETHYHLRWEGKLSLIRKTPWFDYALGPLLGAEIYVPRVEPDQPIGSSERAGISLAIGGSRFGMEADWVLLMGLADWASATPNEYQHDVDLDFNQELAVKLTWAWNGRSSKPPPHGRRMPATAPPAEHVSPPSSQASIPAPANLPVTDPLVVYGAAHCGADPEEFGRWVDQDLDRLHLIQDALDAGKERLRNAGLYGGGGMLLFLAGGGIAVAAALDDWEMNLDDGYDEEEDDDYRSRSASLSHAPVSGGIVLGSLIMVVGSGLSLRGLYLLTFDSAAERALTRAWKSRLRETP
jgi:hypothetical protein